MTILNHSDQGSYITFPSWKYSWDTFWMHGGDDRVYAPSSVTKNLLFYGDGGNDTFLSGQGNDIIYGGADNDRLFGENGADTIRGDTGNDQLYGGNGGDRITGGLGADTMQGGTDRGIDYFHYTRGESTAANGQSDIIEDWNRSHMNLDTDISGNAYNFTEVGVFRLFVPDINMARAVVEANDTLRSKDHVFVYDGTNGYLLSDLNRDYKFETGVTLVGAGHSGDVGWNDII